MNNVPVKVVHDILIDLTSILSLYMYDCVLGVYSLPTIAKMFSVTMIPMIKGTDPERSCLPLSTNEKVLKSKRNVITTSAPKACVAVTFDPGEMTPKPP